MQICNWFMSSLYKAVIALLFQRNCPGWKRTSLALNYSNNERLSYNQVINISFSDNIYDNDSNDLTNLPDLLLYCTSMLPNFTVWNIRVGH